MDILLIGHSGKLGSALREGLAHRGHRVTTAGRSSGDIRVDITDAGSVTGLYDAAGHVDAVVSAAGMVPYNPIQTMTAADYTSAYFGKVGSQIELVRQGVHRIDAHGSFTLITGITARSPIAAGTAASMANGAIESFVRAAAIEIAPGRVNAVSPTVFTESLHAYGEYIPGVPSVDLAAVVQAYVRSIEGALTVQIYVLD